MIKILGIGSADSA